MTYSFDKSILRGYDVRGIYGKTLHNEDAYQAGRCLASCVNAGDTIAIGYDYRGSGKILLERMSAGIRSMNVNVVILGIVPTPAVYYAVRTHSEFAGGVMITGSHNPLEYNGFKMLLRDREISGSALSAFFDVAHALPESMAVEGQERQYSVLGEYTSFLQRHLDYDAFSQKSILWCTAGGVTEEVLRNLIPEMPGRHELLIPPKDSRAPDPLGAENREYIKAALTDVKADLAFAFDGDGDRCVMFDSQGNSVLADKIFLFLANEFLKTTPGSVFVVDSKIAFSLEAIVQNGGGRLISVPTGHTNIKAAMRTSNAVLGAEMSGHYFFCYGGGYAFDDGVYAAIQIINKIGACTWEAVCEESAPLWITEEIRIFVTEKEKEEVRSALNRGAHRCEEVAGGAERYMFRDGLIFLRSSRTEDVVSVRAEGFSQKGFKEVRDRLGEILRVILGRDMAL